MKGLVVAGIVIFMIASYFSAIPTASGFHLNDPIIQTQSKNDDDMKEGHITRPTFGLDHETNKKLVDFGFKLNEKRFSVSDNFHTPFEEQIINIGERNTFEAKVYAQKGLHVQEFLFQGSNHRLRNFIPEPGHSACRCEGHL